MTNDELKEELSKLNNKMDAVLAWQNQQIGYQKANKAWATKISALVSLVISSIIAVVNKLI